MKFGKFGSISPRWAWIQITKNKTFHYQLEFDKFTDQSDLDFSWTTKHDHAGLTLTVSIYKLFWLELSLNDNRHWNYDESKWEDPGDCNWKSSKWENPPDADF